MTLIRAGAGVNRGVLGTQTTATRVASRKSTEDAACNRTGGHTFSTAMAGAQTKHARALSFQVVADSIVAIILDIMRIDYPKSRVLRSRQVLIRIIGVDGLSREAVLGTS